MPKISVIMPVYNGERYLREAIDSILNQTLPDLEFIIINDASIDKTEEIIKSYTDSRIKYIKNETNLGVAGTLNRGLDMAKGEYIARMDADDISLPQRFEKQAEFLDKHRDIAVCGCETIIFGSIDEQNTYTVFGIENMKINMLFSSCLAHPAVMMRKSVIEAENYRYDTNFDKVEDYELWSRIILKYDIDNVKDVLFKYRMHDNQVTKNYSKEHITRLEKIHINLLKSLKVYLTDSENESYLNYCMGNFDVEKQLLDLVCVFNKIVKSNYNIRFFDKKMLKCYFRQIIINLFEKQRKVSRNEIIKVCIFLTKQDFIKYEVKEKIRKYMRKGKQ